jgi:hypothetical protein
MGHEKVEKIEYVVTPENAEWKADDNIHKTDATIKAQQAVEELFAAVAATQKNPGTIEILRVGGMRKKC